MPEDLMRYDQLAQNALRGVVREALRKVEKTGSLPGDHHFYIAFNTRHPGVDIGERLSARYPREMTIVIQHQFWNLAVHDDHFRVNLNFDHVPETLIVPFSAVKGFLDPAVQFGLQFEVVAAEAAPADDGKPAKPAKPARPVTKGKAPSAAAPQNAAPPADDAAAGEPPETPNVVSLDAFRKK
jgi:hypothetical protein